MKKIYLSVVLLIIFSCKNNKFDKVVPDGGESFSTLVIPDNNSLIEFERVRVKPSDLSYTKEERLFNELAKLFADEMQDKGFRKKIKTESLKKFDGDYDVLLRDYIRNIDDNSSILNKMILLGINAEDYPLLNLSIPVNIEKWKPENEEILVAAWAGDKREYVRAYDSKGKVYYLDQNVEPNLPVLVVGYNERVDENGILKKEKKSGTHTSANARIYTPPAPSGLNTIRGSAGNIILEWQDVQNETGYEVWRGTGGTFSNIGTTSQNDNNFVSGGLTAGTKYFYKVRAIDNSGPSAWSNIQALTASNRNHNSSLILRRMKFTQNALQAVEKWPSGAPEIRLRVVRGYPGGASTGYFNTNVFEPNQRNDIKDKWWNHQVTLFSSWDSDGLGSVFTFDWREEDWDDNVSFSVNGSYEDKGDNGTIKVGGSVSWSGDDGGDVIGSTTVYFWDNKFTVYNISGFSWDFQN